MSQEREPTSGERRLAQHVRSGLVDLALFALTWLSVALGYFTWFLGIVITAGFSLVWTFQFFGYRLIASAQRREIEAPASSGPDTSSLTRDERKVAAYFVVGTVALYGTLIALLWVGVHFGVVPWALAIGVTAFLTLGFVVMSVSLWRGTSRILRQRVLPQEAVGTGESIE
jgi:hypothetical protein